VIAGLILSGGASTRMGRPKALLEWRGETFLERLARIVASHCREFVIVTGAHDRELREALPQLAPRMRKNESFEMGQFSSLQCGLQALPLEASVLYWPVDFGAVNEETARVVCAAEGAGLVKPTCGGKSGHPVLFGAEALRVLRGAPVEANAKELLTPMKALKIEVDDAACVRDVDTPEDYRQLREVMG
jgi:CTP:molybdopterin cytidylyltransferase MocA